MTSWDPDTCLVWSHPALTLVVDVSPNGPVAVRALSDDGRPHLARATQPLVEILVAGEGRARASHRFSGTAVGARMVYAGSARSRDGRWHRLEVDARDPVTGLRARTTFRSVDGVSACQVRTEVVNEGPAPVPLLGVTSFAAEFLGHRVEDLDLLRADSEWLGESRWTRRGLREDAVPDLGLALHGGSGRGRFAMVSTGTWSTGTHLPVGAIVDRTGGQAWMWQVEHNGPWRWEVGERLDGAYLALLGPTDIDHQWQPSRTRFPRGIEEVLARIRDRGMTAGLWLEPEVIGVRSPMADELPAEAFLQRGGVRLVEHGRFHLDLRHPRAVAHLDEVVDRLVEQLGVGYFKLDYNIDPGAGTDRDADSVGAGLLAHNRAHLAWLDGVLDRHPDLVLENCASGAMRMDYALLARMQLQSTSDQQDYARYPPVAVAAPMSILPEQSASWAYPQPDMSAEQLAYTMCTGMLGRLYLSGRLDRMAADQLRSVHAAVRVHKEIRADLATAVPLWPLGLPAWDDPQLSLALRAGDVTYVAVWQRPDAARAVELSLPHLRGRQIDVDVLYPLDLPAWTCDWAPDTGSLTVAATRPEPIAARLFRLAAGPIVVARAGAPLTGAAP